jgi:carnitine 3-dehydrogenase
MAAPAPVRPVETFAGIVPAAWCDGNGHMNESRYLQAFSDASDRLMAQLGCDAAYIAAGASFFTAETHLRHLGEALEGDAIRVTTQVMAAGGRRMHLFQRLFGPAGALLATAEQILVHGSLASRRATPPAPAVAARLAELARAHAALPRPEGAGRAVGDPR